jgi:hypothetical protein
MTWTGDNVLPTNFLPYTVADVDATNAVNGVPAVIQATAGGEWIGVVYDQSKLDSAGNPVPNSGVALRTLGIARVIAGGAITAGHYVKVGSSGHVVQASTSDGPVVGRALCTAASGERCRVLLMPGARI